MARQRPPVPVPAWQVAVVGVLLRMDPPDDEDEQRLYFRALGQVPPAVVREVRREGAATAGGTRG